MFPPAHWADDNFDLSLNSNILKMVTVNIAALTRKFLKEYSIIFLMVCGLIYFVLVVLKLLMFKICGIIGISKSEFYNFSDTEKVKF